MKSYMGKCKIHVILKFFPNISIVLDRSSNGGHISLRDIIREEDKIGIAIVLVKVTLKRDKKKKKKPQQKYE